MEQLLELLKAILLGIVQGITEWLPISSTGHMILLDEFMQMQVTPAFKEMFFVVVQLGSILAVLVLYFHKLNPFGASKSKKQQTDTILLWIKVAVAAVPAGIVGVLFDDQIDALFYHANVVAFALIAYGALFILIEQWKKQGSDRITSIQQLDYKTALGVGAFQMLALIPGTSRSGSTILGAMILGMNRSVAAEFSFFLAIPMMFGASFIKLVKFGLVFSGMELAILAIGSITAFLVSVWAIRFLMGYIKKHDFTAFGYYRIVLGIFVLLYFMF